MNNRMRVLVRLFALVLIGYSSYMLLRVGTEIHHGRASFTPDDPRLVCLNGSDADTFNTMLTEIGSGREPVTEEYFSDMIAETVRGRSGFAIAFRTDRKHSPENIMYILTHELAHVFCLTREGVEIEGRYQPEDFAYMGYLIWAETVADYMAYTVLGLKKASVAKMVETLRVLGGKVRADADDRCRAMSDYLSELLWTVEASVPWPTLEAAMKRHDLSFPGMARLVHEQFARERFWEIDEDFLASLGSMYMYEQAVCEFEALRER